MQFDESPHRDIAYRTCLPWWWEWTTGLCLAVVTHDMAVGNGERCRQFGFDPGLGKLLDPKKG